MDGLLAVARAENVVPVPAAVDVAAVARERVVAWHPVADDRGITPRRQGGPSPDAGSVLAWIGEGHLEQVLDNLIANALDALSAGGHITVTATVTTAGAQITVTDDGPGMRRRGPGARLPAVHHLEPERHRAGPGHRAPPGHLERRHGPAGRDTRRRADRHP